MCTARYWSTRCLSLFVIKEQWHYIHCYLSYIHFTQINFRCKAAMAHKTITQNMCARAVSWGKKSMCDWSRSNLIQFNYQRLLLTYAPIYMLPSSISTKFKTVPGVFRHKITLLQRAIRIADPDLSILFDSGFGKKEGGDPVFWRVGYGPGFSRHVPNPDPVSLYPDRQLCVQWRCGAVFITKFVASVLPSITEVNNANNNNNPYVYIYKISII